MRYLLIPLASPALSVDNYQTFIADVLRYIADGIRMTPLGELWDFNHLSQLQHGIEAGDPIPEEFTHPLVADAQSLTDALATCALPFPVRRRLDELLGDARAPKSYMRLTPDEANFLKQWRQGHIELTLGHLSTARTARIAGKVYKDNTGTLTDIPQAPGATPPKTGTNT